MRWFILSKIRLCQTVAIIESRTLHFWPISNIGLQDDVLPLYSILGRHSDAVLG